MEDRTPREKLRESLRENSERVREWPEWLRAAISTADVFHVPPAKTESDLPRDEG